MLYYNIAVGDITPLNDSALPKVALRLHDDCIQFSNFLNLNTYFLFCNTYSYLFSLKQFKFFIVTLLQQIFVDNNVQCAIIISIKPIIILVLYSRYSQSGLKITENTTARHTTIKINRNCIGRLVEDLNGELLSTYQI